MNKDFRRNVLATISQLLRKIHNFKHFDHSARRQSYSHGLQIDIQLLRSDFMLILNQNFYLQCKLEEKDKLLLQLQKKFSQLEESSKLNIQMATNRYEKLLHSLKYEQFWRRDEEHNQEMAKNIESCIQQQFRYISAAKVEQLPTPIKPIHLRNMTSSLDSNQTIQRHPRNGQTSEKYLTRAQNLKFGTRLAQNAKSEQITKLEENLSVQKAKSKQITVKQTNYTKKEGSIAARSNSAAQVENRKQKQLQLLVEEQAKVAGFKESYFCIDLQ